MRVASSATMEKPQNGLAGLKHWRHDLAAGLVVSLISLPFSLGIAVASGAPAICGLISAIIAGLVLPFLGGSYVTVSGPAAGLAPVLLASMLLLGRGDLKAGYPLLLVAICFTGLVQVVLARMKLARFSALFPASVVEGMLAAIGLLIVAKQLPLLVGHRFQAHDFWPILAEAPSQFLRMDPKVFFVGMSCLGLIFALASLNQRWLKAVPPQVLAAVLGLVLAGILGLKGDHLIRIPDQPFKHGIVLPNFRGILADSSLWFALTTTVVTLALIDGIESLATIAAVDKIDPFRRKSDPNRTLFAMGVSNVCSSLAGGLTIIPGGVKSTACIVGGGRTQWANFYNACFLILYLLLGRGVINMIPMSALGAIIIYTGYKLCAPKVWRHVARIGGEQLFVFTTTVLVTVSTDLLWGIAAGIAAKLLVESVIRANVERGRPGAPVSLGSTMGRWASHTGELFRNPIVQCRTVGEDYQIYFGRPLVCFNCVHLDAALERIPSGCSTVSLHLTELVTLVDYTAAGILRDFVDNFQQSGRGVARIIGLERLQGRSHEEACLRVSAPVLADDRAKALAELSRMSLTQGSGGTEVSDPIAYLDQVSLTRLEPIRDWTVHPITESLLFTYRYVESNVQNTAELVRTVRVPRELASGGNRERRWYYLTPTQPAYEWPPRLDSRSDSPNWPPRLDSRESESWPPSID